MQFHNISANVLRHVATFALASAIAVPMGAQDSTTSPTDPQAAPSASEQQPSPTASQPLSQPKEGFWGHINPFASKKWVKRQTDPINDRLSELDEVNSKNARDIKDVDDRAQAGIQKAQSSADEANQTANSANQQAMNASSTAQQASGHVDQINSTVNGLDQYHPITDLDVRFRGGSATLSSDSRAKLDELAASLTGREGYIVEMEAHSPAAGGAGIQNSQRLAEAIERYLVTQHQIPIYRMHYVALGNAQAPATGDENQKPQRVRVSSVHLTLMENSLAARAEASPQSAPAAAGAEQP